MNGATLWVLAIAYLLMAAVAATCEALRQLLAKPGQLADWWFVLQTRSWSQLPVLAVRATDRFLSLLLGDRIVSLRALVFGALPSFVLADVTLAFSASKVTGTPLSFASSLASAAIPAAIAAVTIAVLRGLLRWATRWLPTDVPPHAKQVKWFTGLVYFGIVAIPYIAVGLCLVVVQILNDVISRSFGKYPAVLLVIPRVIIEWPIVVLHTAQHSPWPLLLYDLSLILPAALVTLPVVLALSVCWLVAVFQDALRLSASRLLERAEKWNAKALGRLAVVLGYGCNIVSAIAGVVALARR